MAAKDLITLSRAYVAIQSQSPGSIDTQLAIWITAASDAIEKYCRRQFFVNFYDELYSGDGQRKLLLRQYPIQSVQACRYRPTTVLKIINNNTSQNQQARVQVTSTGITLTRVASGVLGTDIIGFSSYPTLSGLAAYINSSIGNGWEAQVQGDTVNYGLWPSADLYVPPSFGDGATSQGNLTAVGVFAELKMHTYELAGYQFDPRGWLLRAIPYTDPELLHPEDLIWSPGINNFRIQYYAGYNTIPEAVQEACAEWVAHMWYLANRDPAIANQVTSNTASTSAGSTATSGAEAWSFPADIRPPIRILGLLAPYRRHTVASNMG